VTTPTFNRDAGASVPATGDVSRRSGPTTRRTGDVSRRVGPAGANNPATDVAGSPETNQRTAPTTLLAGSSSSIFVTMTSVVSIRPAMLAAFSSADRVTLVGSRMPALIMSTYSPVLAS